MSEPNVVPAPPEIQELRLVCSWCQRVMREGAPGPQTSHGICTGCRSLLETNSDSMGKAIADVTRSLES